MSDDEFIRRLLKEPPTHEDFEDGRCDECGELGGHIWMDGVWLCHACADEFEAGFAE